MVMPGEAAGPARQAAAKAEGAAGARGPKADPAGRFADAVRRAERALRGDDPQDRKGAAGAPAPSAAPAASDAEGIGGDRAARRRPVSQERREGEPGQAPRAAPPSPAAPASAEAAAGAPQTSLPGAGPKGAGLKGAGEATPGHAAAHHLLPALGPRLPASFTITFPPNAWPLIKAEGLRGPKGLSLRLTAADAKDEARLKSAIAGLRDELEAAGHAVEAIVVLTGGE